MPIHDWTRVDAGIFPHFHQRWIGAITDVLNQRLLPGEYYALAEQQGAGFEPEVLTLKANVAAPEAADKTPPDVPSTAGHCEGNGAGGGPVLVAPPRVSVIAETD